MTNQLLRQFASYQRAKGLADTTVKNRESILRTLEKYSAAKLGSLTLFDLREYLGRPGVADGSRRTERGAMIAFYNFLHEEGLRADDPTERLATISAAKGEPRPFTREQIDAMLTSGAYRQR